MNDFTKLELELLYQCVTGNRNYQGGQMFPELNSKIQSLIDNYCDHKNRESAYDEEHGHHVYCTNCYKVYDMENK